ncbi:Cyanophycin synthetase [Clarias magur]|uniref:Cyanophycin synthetase n=1 Tax=Clarias magur TaxID=1594786 RepID=A0A8J4UMA8_CLAMG|nr:Cyanophycin synthetase [Clarias magur]
MRLGSWEATLFISPQYPKAFATLSIRMINYSCCDPGDKTHMVSFCLAGCYLGALERHKAISAQKLKKQEVDFVFVRD